MKTRRSFVHAIRSKLGLMGTSFAGLNSEVRALIHPTAASKTILVVCMPSVDEDEHQGACKVCGISWRYMGSREMVPWLEQQDGHPGWPAHVRATLADLARRLGHGVCRLLAPVETPDRDALTAAMVGIGMELAAPAVSDPNIETRCSLLRPR